MRIRPSRRKACRFRLFSERIRLHRAPLVCFRSRFRVLVGALLLVTTMDAERLGCDSPNGNWARRNRRDEFDLGSLRFHGCRRCFRALSQQFAFLAKMTTRHTLAPTTVAIPSNRTRRTWSRSVFNSALRSRRSFAISPSLVIGRTASANRVRVPSVHAQLRTVSPLGSRDS